MSQSLFQAHEVVFSPKFGLAKVLGEESVQGHDEKYYILESLDTHSKIMVPVSKAQKSIRHLLEKEELQDVLKRFETEYKLLEFESKKDRIRHFQKMQKSVNLEDSLSALYTLQNIEDLGKVEQQILENIQKNLRVEIDYILDDAEDALWNKVSTTIGISQQAA